MITRNRKRAFKDGNILGGFTVKTKLKGGPYILVCNKCGKETKQSHSNVKNLIVTGKQRYCGDCNRELNKQSWNYKANILYPKYKYQAEQRGYKFKISKKEFKNLIKQNCYYCDKSPSNIFTRDGYTLYYNGLDRVDNNKGYLIDNIVPCCKQCNVAKHHYTQKEFLDWILAVHDKMFNDYPERE